MPVNNPVAFIGEQILGATVGSPLSTDANGKLASGIANSEFTATATTTTTSASDAIINSMTATPVAGTYLVLFSAWFSHSAAGATINVSIYSGGSQKTDSVRTVIPNGGGVGYTAQDIPLSTQGIVTVNGSQVVSIEWNTSASTATCHQRTMNLIRLS